MGNLGKDGERIPASCITEGETEAWRSLCHPWPKYLYLCSGDGAEMRIEHQSLPCQGR